MLISTSRISESPIWQLQKIAYARLGVASWAKGHVPFQITNNSRIAAQYADIASAAFPKSSFTILELGGGCGKFAFLMLGELFRRNVPNVRYILTDAAEKNWTFWNEHPLLRPWIDRGILQTAVFDPLSEDAPSADLIVANYFFDSLPQDLFRVEKGAVLEGLASLHTEDKTTDWDDPSLLSKLRITYAFQPLVKNPYPECPQIWSVLQDYSHRFDGLSFLLPIGAIRTIRRIASAFKKDWLFLAADRGPCTAEDLNRMSLLPSLHGNAFSFPVNFDAIDRYMEKTEGGALFSRANETDFSIALLSSTKEILPQAKRCFENLEFGPLRTEALDFSGMLKRLEESNWDATLFFSFFDRIQASIGQAGTLAKMKMLEGVGRVRDQFFPMFREEAILLERLGLFFQSLGKEKDSEISLEMTDRFKKLPEHNFSIAVFLNANPPSGDVLQIGDNEEVFQSIRSHNVRKHVHIPWDGSIENLGQFDTVFLLPARLTVQRIKPAFVQEIEGRFSLDTIRYSDADIETFFAALSKSADPNHVLHFFVELERKKNINRDQFCRIAKRLGVAPPLKEEEDRLFETLMVCLRQHMLPGSVLRAFIPGIATYDDPRFFEEVVVDPFLETEEREEPQGVWVTVRRYSQTA